MRRMTRSIALALVVLSASFAAPTLAREQRPPAEKAAKHGDAKAQKADAASELPAELYATFVTTQGRIGVRLFPESKPNAVRNFVQLAEGKREWTDPRTGRKVKRPLYDGTVFHRVIPGFMIQGGDPLGNGTGGPGYELPDELDLGESFFEKPCQLAYANHGPNTNGSQFFITEVPTLHLQPVRCDRSPSGVCGYVRFGEGVCGCDLVAKIARLGNNQTKLEKVLISKTKPTCK
jgi:peptidyl-prolyl cis-trans isomerase A (cyclophilin A)